ncbi:hypothetical protein Bpfe_029381 [Biomphalaria pfeifferi]|uniref:Uncharacterized protein n=1 Tax=Biomphalaria pfeifferi TaxID=112525 RepID=A0AAD8AUH2_BIOPF|nr:hypothetical protein Bpfe_029381 [Biomphalaria pfeifferi]
MNGLTVLHIMLSVLGQYTCSRLGVNTFYSFNHKDGQLIEFNLRAKSKSWYFKVRAVLGQQHWSELGLEIAPNNGG